MLEPTGPEALRVDPGSIQVTGSILVNSTNTTAARVYSGGSVTATGTIGGPRAPAGFVGSFNPTPTNRPAGTDPYSALILCPASPACPATPPTPYPSVIRSGGTATANPGVYRSIEVSSGGRLTLNPGTYVVTERLLVTGSGSRLTGTGVTIYLACSTYPTPCSANASGAFYANEAGATVTISAPTTGAYSCLSLISDRNNAGQVRITGAGAATTAGGVYLRSAKLLVDTGSANLTRAVVDTVETKNSGALLRIIPTGSLSVTVPGTRDYGSTPPGQTISGLLGTVTVTDQRCQTPSSWTATVTATNLSTGGATGTISRSNVAYWSGQAVTTTGTGTFTPGQPTSAQAQSLGSPRTAFTVTGGDRNTTATWNPTLRITVPPGAVAGRYTGTITHSVA
ncbi:hypothetical protein AB0873_12635 [Micromonospora sp. NPDC047707]|uniref:hypothetical protein n=1 Tax=Micromonospora sp. NPDC047707 TaxID=3154498 RepID=UPI0034520AB2